MEAAHVSPRAALPEPPGTGGGGRQRRTMSIHLGRLRMLIRVLAEAEKARSKTTLKTCQNNAFEKLLAYHTAAAESIENMKRLSEVLNERLDNTDLLLPNRRGYTPEGPDRLTLADEIVDFFSQPRANDAFETAQSPADVRMFDETLRKKLAADRLARGDCLDPDGTAVEQQEEEEEEDDPEWAIPEEASRLIRKTMRFCNTMRRHMRFLQGETEVLDTRFRDGYKSLNAALLQRVQANFNLKQHLKTREDGPGVQRALELMTPSDPTSEEFDRMLLLEVMGPTHMDVGTDMHVDPGMAPLEWQRALHDLQAERNPASARNRTMLHAEWDAPAALESPHHSASPRHGAGEGSSDGSASPRSPNQLAAPAPDGTPEVPPDKKWKRGLQKLAAIRRLSATTVAPQGIPHGDLPRPQLQRPHSLAEWVGRRKPQHEQALRQIEAQATAWGLDMHEGFVPRSPAGHAPEAHALWDTVFAVAHIPGAQALLDIPAAAQKAMALEYQVVARACLQAAGGTTIQWHADTLQCWFPSVLAAARFAADLQLKLMEVSWAPAACAAFPVPPPRAPGEPPIWHGPRATVALHMAHKASSLQVARAAYDAALQEALSLAQWGRGGEVVLSGRVPVNAVPEDVLRVHPVPEGPTAVQDLAPLRVAFPPALDERAEDMRQFPFGSGAPPDGLLMGSRLQALYDHHCQAILSCVAILRRAVELGEPHPKDAALWSTVQRASPRRRKSMAPAGVAAMLVVPPLPIPEEPPEDGVGDDDGESEAVGEVGGATEDNARAAPPQKVMRRRSRARRRSIGGVEAGAQQEGSEGEEGRKVKKPRSGRKGTGDVLDREADPEARAETKKLRKRLKKGSSRRQDSGAGPDGSARDLNDLSDTWSDIDFDLETEASSQGTSRNCSRPESPISSPSHAPSPTLSLVAVAETKLLARKVRERVRQGSMAGVSEPGRSNSVIEDITLSIPDVGGMALWASTAEDAAPPQAPALRTATATAAAEAGPGDPVALGDDDLERLERIAELETCIAALRAEAGAAEAAEAKQLRRLEQEVQRQRRCLKGLQAHENESAVRYYMLRMSRLAPEPAPEGPLPTPDAVAPADFKAAMDRRVAQARERFRREQRLAAQAGALEPEVAARHSHLSAAMAQLQGLVATEDDAPLEAEAQQELLLRVREVEQRLGVANADDAAAQQFQKGNAPTAAALAARIGCLRAQFGAGAAPGGAQSRVDLVNDMQRQWLGSQLDRALHQLQGLAALEAELLALEAGPAAADAAGGGPEAQPLATRRAAAAERVRTHADLHRKGLDAITAEMQRASDAAQVEARAKYADLLATEEGARALARVRGVGPVRAAAQLPGLLRAARRKPRRQRDTGREPLGPGRGPEGQALMQQLETTLQSLTEDALSSFLELDGDRLDGLSAAVRDAVKHALAAPDDAPGCPPAAGPPSEGPAELQISPRMAQEVELLRQQMGEGLEEEVRRLSTPEAERRMASLQSRMQAALRRIDAVASTPLERTQADHVRLLVAQKHLEFAVRCPPERHAALGLPPLWELQKAASAQATALVEALKGLRPTHGACDDLLRGAQVKNAKAVAQRYLLLQATPASGRHEALRRLWTEFDAAAKRLVRPLDDPPAEDDARAAHREATLGYLKVLNAQCQWMRRQPDTEATALAELTRTRNAVLEELAGAVLGEGAPPGPPEAPDHALLRMAASFQSLTEPWDYDLPASPLARAQLSLAVRDFTGHAPLHTAPAMAAATAYAQERLATAAAAADVTADGVAEVVGDAAKDLQRQWEFRPHVPALLRAHWDAAATLQRTVDRALGGAEAERRAPAAAAARLRRALVGIAGLASRTAEAPGAGAAVELFANAAAVGAALKSVAAEVDACRRAGDVAALKATAHGVTARLQALRPWLEGDGHAEPIRRAHALLQELHTAAAGDGLEGLPLDQLSDRVGALAIDLEDYGGRLRDESGAALRPVLDLCAHAQRALGVVQEVEALVADERQPLSRAHALYRGCLRALQDVDRALQPHVRDVDPPRLAVAVPLVRLQLLHSDAVCGAAAPADTLSEAAAAAAQLQQALKGVPGDGGLSEADGQALRLQHLHRQLVLGGGGPQGVGVQEQLGALLQELVRARYGGDPGLREAHHIAFIRGLLAQSRATRSSEAAARLEDQVEVMVQALGAGDPGAAAPAPAAAVVVESVLGLGLEGAGGGAEAPGLLLVPGAGPRDTSGGGGAGGAGTKKAIVTKLARSVGAQRLAAIHRTMEQQKTRLTLSEKQANALKRLKAVQTQKRVLQFMSTGDTKAQLSELTSLEAELQAELAHHTAQALNICGTSLGGDGAQLQARVLELEREARGAQRQLVQEAVAIAKEEEQRARAAASARMAQLQKLRGRGASNWSKAKPRAAVALTEMKLQCGTDLVEQAAAAATTAEIVRSSAQQSLAVLRDERAALRAAVASAVSVVEARGFEAALERVELQVAHAAHQSTASEVALAAQQQRLAGTQLQHLLLQLQGLMVKAPLDVAQFWGLLPELRSGVGELGRAAEATVARLLAQAAERVPALEGRMAEEGEAAKTLPARIREVRGQAARAQQELQELDRAEWQVVPGLDAQIRGLAVQVEAGEGDAGDAGAQLQRLRTRRQEASMAFKDQRTALQQRAGGLRAWADDKAAELEGAAGRVRALEALLAVAAQALAEDTLFANRVRREHRAAADAVRGLCGAAEAQREAHVAPEALRPHMQRVAAALEEYLRVAAAATRETERRRAAARLGADAAPAAPVADAQPAADGGDPVFYFDVECVGAMPPEGPDWLHVQMSQAMHPCLALRDAECQTPMEWALPQSRGSTTGVSPVRLSRSGSCGPGGRPASDGLPGTAGRRSRPPARRGDSPCARPGTSTSEAPAVACAVKSPTLGRSSAGRSTADSPQPPLELSGLEHPPPKALEEGPPKRTAEGALMQVSLARMMRGAPGARHDRPQGSPRKRPSPRGRGEGPPWQSDPPEAQAVGAHPEATPLRAMLQKAEELYAAVCLRMAAEPPPDPAPILRLFAGVLQAADGAPAVRSPRGPAEQARQSPAADRALDALVGAPITGFDPDSLQRLRAAFGERFAVALPRAPSDAEAPELMTATAQLMWQTLALLGDYAADHATRVAAVRALGRAAMPLGVPDAVARDAAAARPAPGGGPPSAASGERVPGPGVEAPGSRAPQPDPGSASPPVPASAAEPAAEHRHTPYGPAGGVPQLWAPGLPPQDRPMPHATVLGAVRVADDAAPAPAHVPPSSDKGAPTLSTSVPVLAAPTGPSVSVPAPAPSNTAAATEPPPVVLPPLYIPPAPAAGRAVAERPRQNPNANPVSFVARAATHFRGRRRVRLQLPPSSPEAPDAPAGTPLPALAALEDPLSLYALAPALLKTGMAAVQKRAGAQPRAELAGSFGPDKPPQAELRDAAAARKARRRRSRGDPLPKIGRQSPSPAPVAAFTQRRAQPARLQLVTKPAGTPMLPPINTTGSNASFAR